jgi:glycosyltransferase involved in cell wall biosynthesis
LYLVATELANDPSFAVSFITADYGQPEIEIIQNVKVIKSLNPAQTSLTGAFKLSKAMKKASAQIYIQKTASWGTFFVAMFCKFCKKVFLYRTATAGECDGTYLKRYFVRKAFYWAIRQARQVFVQNETDLRNINTLLGINAVMIRNGHRIRPLSDVKRDSILWVGRSAKEKQPELFIKLAKEFPQERFIMICQQATGDTFYDKLASYAATAKNIEFVRHVDFNKIDGFFEKAKVFVNTSDFEGFPNTFIQACKSGAPILSLNVNPDGFLDAYKCGKCAKGDWQTFKNMLIELLDSPTAAQYGANALRYAQENHDITRIIEQYKEIFKNISKAK